MIDIFLTPYSIAVEINNMLGSTIITNAMQTFHPVDLQGGRFFYLYYKQTIHFFSSDEQYFYFQLKWYSILIIFQLSINFQVKFWKF